MLVLTRRVGEIIVIGDLVELRIIAIYENSIRLAIVFLQKDTPQVTVTLNITESVNIGDQIAVTAVLSRGTQARIGITAPPDLPISRAETEASEGGKKVEPCQEEPDGQEAE